MSKKTETMAPDWAESDDTTGPRLRFTHDSAGVPVRNEEDAEQSVDVQFLYEEGEIVATLRDKYLNEFGDEDSTFYYLLSVPVPKARAIRDWLTRALAEVGDHE